MPLTIDSPAVQSYLQILQGVISRMAANSANAKTWCIALVSAIAVVVAQEDNAAHYVWVAVVPIVLFFLLDAYYLGLERLFRDLYNTFIRKLHANEATVDDVYIVNPGTSDAILKAAGGAILSLSVWPFYGLLLLMLALVKCLVL